MSELGSELAATANSTADTPTVDAVLDDAFTSPDEPATSDPSPPAEPTPEPAAAIAQPPTPTETKPEVATGEPPRERWDQILANARTKAREEALAEHKDALEIVNRLRQDFAGTLTQLLDEGVADQRFADQLTSRAAAILAAKGKRADADPRPEPDQSDDRYVWYSPEQQAKLDAWKERQIEKKLMERFKPLQDLQAEVQQQRERQQWEQKATQEAITIAKERGAEWEAAPLFKDNKEVILKRQGEIYADLEAAVQRGERRPDPVNLPWVALQRAYNEFVTTHALPKLQSQTVESQIAAAAHKKAGNASDPAASLPAQPRKPRTVDEALDQVFSGIA